MERMPNYWNRNSPREALPSILCLFPALAFGLIIVGQWSAFRNETTMENIMKDFLLHFSAVFIAVTFSMAFLWPLVRSASDARPPFVSAKAFPELAGLGKDEQKRLLAEATRASFRHWRSFVPFLVFGIFFATGDAMARTLPKVTSVPDSFWATVITVSVFVLPGAWLAGRLSANHIRPFLKKCIESSDNAV